MDGKENVSVEFDRLRAAFIRHMIFGPAVIELSADYHEVLLSLNVWPTGCMEQQRRGMLKRERFTIKRTLVKTGYETTTLISQDGTRNQLESFK